MTGPATPTVYVAGTGGPVNLDRLRQHLVTRLPEYLIPPRVVVLDRLPLTLDGEYDLESLPDPVGADRDLEEELT